MVAQRRALVVAAEQAAALQFRHDEIDEIGERAGEIRRQDVEPVGRALDEPFLERVGDPLRRAAHAPSGRAPPRSGCRGRAASCSRAAPSRRARWEGPAALGPAAAAAPARRADGRTRRSRSGWRPGSRRWSGVSQLCSFASFSRASASLSPMIGITPGSTASSSGRAAVFRHAALQVGIGGLGRLQLLHHREHDVGGARRQLQSRRRAAGLDDDRMALRAARHVDRALDLEEPALVVERAHLAGIDVTAGRLVGDDRAVVPAIPQPADDIDELVGALVAQLVLDVLVAG